MITKWIGAGLIILGCGVCGYLLVASQKREERLLRDLIVILDYMECELQYRMTPLPELCRRTAQNASEELGSVLVNLASFLESKTSPDVGRCMDSVLHAEKTLPGGVLPILEELGANLGHFGLEGQIKGIVATRQQCRNKLDKLIDNKDMRLRSYQTLWLCGGAALAILFI